MKKSILLFAILISVNTIIYSQPCLPDGITFNTQTQIDSFQINYPSCTEIEGHVEINGNDITNLNGLNNLVSIGEYLEIKYNNNLNNLDGLNNLISVGGYISIEHNHALTSISALSSIDTINGSLSIVFNDLLTSLSGWQNLKHINGYFSVINNDALTNLEGLNNLVSVCGILQISENNNLYNLEGLNNLTSLGGPISISSNSSLTSISALSNTAFSDNEDNWRFVEISGNDALINLEGLNSIDTIGDRLIIENNESLTSLSGLQNLKYISGEFMLDQNDALTNLEGLNNLNHIGDVFFITRNDALTNLEGLNNLTTLMHDFYIFSNNSLLSLSGINNLTDTKVIEINGNPILTDITALANVESNFLGSLIIKYNPSLSKCDIESICNYLFLPDANVEINKNATGCNSKEEVMAACKEGVYEINSKPVFTIYPNPATKDLFISSDSELVNAVTIYNYLGQKIMVKTKPIDKIDISMLKQGIYVIELVSNKYKTRHKLIIQ